MPNGGKGVVEFTWDLAVVWAHVDALRGVGKNIQGQAGAAAGLLQLGGGGQPVAAARGEHLRLACCRQVYGRRIPYPAVIASCGV